jgi:hypothetical protein
MPSFFVTYGNSTSGVLFIGIVLKLSISQQDSDRTFRAFSDIYYLPFSNPDIVHIQYHKYSTRPAVHPIQPYQDKVDPPLSQAELGQADWQRRHCDLSPQYSLTRHGKSITIEICYLWSSNLSVAVSAPSPPQLAVP